jgi:hypothetical protein
MRRLPIYWCCESTLGSNETRLTFLNPTLSRSLVTDPDSRFHQVEEEIEGKKIRRGIFACARREKPLQWRAEGLAG